jgi:hypothetical protein
MERRSKEVAMRRRLAVRLLIMTVAVALAGMLCVAVVAPTTAVGQGYSVVFVYQAINYYGYYSAFDANSKDANLTNNTVGNDTASSLEILDPACSVRLYEHTSFGKPFYPHGRSITFYRDIPDLRVYGWNDIASSLKVSC